jgi:hypothetical protein
MPESPLFAIPMLEGGSDYPTPDATADSKQINDQFKYTEQFLGIKPVTSGTLPSTPKTQQLIYETDTGNIRFWDGDEWITVEQNDKTGGTTAERDTQFGTPGSAGDRVALANKCPMWFNTEKGYTERYFSATADASALPRNSAAVAGWYPGIPGELNALAYITAGSAAIADTLLPIAVDQVTDPFRLIKASQKFIPGVAGIWEISGYLGQSGTVALQLFAKKNGSPTGVEELQEGQMGTTGASASPRFTGQTKLLATDEITFFGKSASGSIAYLSSSQVFVKYIRPHL